MIEQAQGFEIKLPMFEGPFDLLLFFIERDELDIHDIPIAKISREFNDYLHHMSSMNIELAGEFILVAATLMRIKAKMLIPRYNVEEGVEEDPRQDLVQQLLDYKRYKEAAVDLREMEELRTKIFQRGNLAEEMDRICSMDSLTGNRVELTQLSLYKLLKTFERVMNRFQTRPDENLHQVYKYPYTVEEQTDFIRKLLTIKPKLSADDIFEGCKDRIHAIFTFLALLDLLQTKVVGLVCGEGFNNFWISSHSQSTYHAN
ncbi:MAG: segregation/condensation protein A [Bacteroidia bacterium]|nr:segregation/condensation protein A [Bacteroidia bacterium]